MSPRIVCSLFRIVLLYFHLNSCYQANAFRFSGSSESNANKLFDPHVEQERARSDTRSLPFRRETQLYSRASGNHVRIIGRRVDASGLDGDKYAKLIIESDNFGRVRIRGAETGHYLCMRKDGRLIGRKKSPKPRCVFYEEYAANSFTEFRSTVNKKWWLTFSKRGKARPGRKGRAGSKTVQFIERATMIIIPSGPDNVEESLVKGLQTHIARLLKAYRATKAGKKTGLKTPPRRKRKNQRMKKMKRMKRMKRKYKRRMRKKQRDARRQGKIPL